MAEAVQTGLVRAVQVANDADVHRSANGLHFATFGETGVPAPDLQSMIEAVPPAITAALKTHTYFFVPLALREPEAARTGDSALVAETYTKEFDERAICHRSIALGTGRQGVFISTRLMGDRFALCFEFFINIAHAFTDETGVPASFADLVWEQATGGGRGRFGVVRGETSMDAFEARNLALGREAHDDGSGASLAAPRDASRETTRRNRAFSLSAAAAPVSAPRSAVDEKERNNYIAAAFSDALAMYLLSLAVDFDYGELREREYPLLAPAALAARLKLVAELFPANAGYEFAIRYRRRA
jgi:hypothetical protein